MKHRSVEKTLGSIRVNDTYVYGEMELRIVTGGKSPDVHIVDVSTIVDFDRSEKDKYGVHVPGAPRVELTMDGAIEALVDQLNARAGEVMKALELVKVA